MGGEVHHFIILYNVCLVRNALILVGFSNRFIFKIIFSQNVVFDLTFSILIIAPLLCHCDDH